MSSWRHHSEIMIHYDSITVVSHWHRNGQSSQWRHITDHSDIMITSQWYHDYITVISWLHHSDIMITSQWHHDYFTIHNGIKVSHWHHDITLTSWWYHIGTMVHDVNTVASQWQHDNITVTSWLYHNLASRYHSGIIVLPQWHNNYATVAS